MVQIKQVVLDTNFIMACIKRKIDFFNEIKFMGYKVLIPKEVIKELKKIINSKQKLHNKETAKIALKIIKLNKFKKIELKKKNVDNAIAEFANSNKGIIVATLDKDLKNKIKGQKMIIRDKKKLEVV